AAADVRVAERGRGGASNVTPLTRYRAVTPERPTPVLRLPGQIVTPYPAGAFVNATVLAVPSEKLPEIRGWRSDFSSLTEQEIAERLRPAPVALHGPVIDGSRLRVWARAKTDYPRIVVVHLLEPGQNFAAIGVGLAANRWHLLS